MFIMKKILLLGFMLACLGLNAQTTIYTLDFSVIGGFNHSSANPPAAGPQVFNGANYVLGYDLAPSTDASGNFFESDGSKLISRDFGGAAYFQTNVIDISAAQQIDILGLGNQLGDVFNGPGEFLRWFYILDGGTPVQGPMANSAASSINTPATFSNIDVSSNNTLVVGFEFNFNGGTNGIEITSLIVQAFTAGANTSPLISNLVQTPSTAIVNDTDVVSITADVTDDVAVQAVNLLYDVVATGTAFDGTYDNAVVMTATMSSYMGTINAQLSGNTVYYAIEATDGNMPTAGVTTTATASYDVLAQQPRGLQLTTVDAPVLIDFDTTVANVNNGPFAATGFALVPSIGQLDANAFAITGLSDGDTGFGDVNTGADFGRGISTGGVGTAGIYAFEVSTGDVALGVQPTGAELTPGSISFLFTNNTGVTINELSIAYDVYTLSNEGRQNNIVFSHGMDLTSLVAVPASEVRTILTDDPAAAWERNLVALDLTGITIPVGATYVLSWNIDEIGGAGSSDELGLDNIQLIANPATNQLTASGDFKTLNLLGNVSLTSASNLTDILKLESGTLTTNNNLTLKSTAGKSAIIAPVVSGAITGNVTVEQFYPARRAFRFVSSPVTMSGTIFSDWQQGGLNPMDMGYVAGLGTQITGGTANGFDVSATNAPSLFSYDNLNQVWMANATSTNVGLNAGDARRLLVRGDRSVSLTTVNAPATATTLTATGTLATGSQTLTMGLSTTAGGFNLVGNPYQAQVDVLQVLGSPFTQDINSDLFYVWNPNAGTRGAYVTYTRGSGTTPAMSAVNEFIQPGQAFFTVSTDSDANSVINPAIRFEEGFKNSSSQTTATFSTPANNSAVSIDILTPSDLQAGIARDGVLVQFSTTGTDAITSKDAVKIQNLDENLAIVNNSTLLSVESRAIPQDGDIIPLQLTGTQSGTYHFVINSNMQDGTLLLVDQYLNTNTTITNGTNQVNVQLDSAVAASIASDRFYLKFTTGTLGLDDEITLNTIKVYPNPNTGESINITGFQSGDKVLVNMFNLNGQKVFNLETLPNNGVIAINNLLNLHKSVYLLEVTQNNKTIVQKILIY